MKKFIPLLIALLLWTLGPSASAQAGSVNSAFAKVPWTVTYADGSGNTYRISRDFKNKDAHFEYIPVRPENSSSGIYSGGEARKGVLDRSKAEELWRWIEKLQADPTLRSESRMMGTGAFTLLHESRSQSFIIKNGPQLGQFNDFLGKISGKPVSK